MFLFPEWVFVLRGSCDDLWEYVSAASFYQYEWYMKITDICVEGPTEKLANKPFRLTVSCDLCQEQVWDRNRAIVLRRQNLALISGRFSGHAGSSTVMQNFRLENSVFYYVNKPSDVVRLIVGRVEPSDIVVEELSFCVRVLFFKVRPDE